jgi:hypothetical protein
MKQRCGNPKRPDYERYGGKGVTVCERWKNSLADFVADVGPRPSPEHTIDRIKSTGPYEPGNVKWSTREEQSENRSNSMMVEFGGQTHCLSAWARLTGINFNTLRHRYRIGLRGEALFDPIVARWKNTRPLP